MVQLVPSASPIFAHTRLAYHTAAGKMAKLDGDHHRVQRTTGTDHQEFFFARKNKTSRQPISNYCRAANRTPMMFFLAK